MIAKTEDIGEPSLWIPETDPVRLAVMGKALEECGELTAILARCIIQGVEGIDPDTGEANSVQLWKEMADMYAQLELVTRCFDLDRSVIADRATRKRIMKTKWTKMLFPFQMRMLRIKDYYMGRRHEP